MVLVACVRVERCKTQVVLDKYSDGKKVADIGIATFKIRVNLLVVSIHRCVVNDVAVECVPDIATIDCAIHRT